MIIRVGNEVVGAGGRIDLRADDALTVSGDDILSVQTANGIAFEQLAEGGWGPPGELEDELVDSGEVLLLDVRTSSGVVRVAVRGVGVHLRLEHRQALIDALGGLATAFERPRRWRRMAAGGEGGGDVSGAEKHIDESNRELWRALEDAVPRLLLHPIEVREIVTGPTPVERLAPSPVQLLARMTQPARRLLLARHARIVPAQRDYRWLYGVLASLWAYADEKVRLDVDLTGETQHGGKFWMEPLRRIGDWTRHPVFNDIERLPLREPSWSLSRSVSGAAIMRALAESTLVPGLGAGTALHRVPLAPDSHLYELWVILSVVDVLRERFGFELVDGPKRFEDVGETRGGRWFLRNLDLVWNGHSVDGEPLIVEVQLRHEPELRGHESPRTPDLVMDVCANGRSTRHVLDAKLRGSPLSLARKCARDRYLLGLKERPTSSFVVLPGVAASAKHVMRQIDAGLRDGRRLDAVEDLRVADGKGDFIYGFAWGSVQAAPVGLEAAKEAPLGLQQFVMMALQYHRTELRHVCGNCGQALTLSHLDLQSRSLVADADKLAAHGDERTVDKHGHISPRRGRLTYRCKGMLPSGLSCGHTWSRDVCGHGHVLMKYGRLTPHHRSLARGKVDDDWNVHCAACGHFRGGKQWPSTSTVSDLRQVLD